MKVTMINNLGFLIQIILLVDLWVGTFLWCVIVIEKLISEDS